MNNKIVDAIEVKKMREKIADFGKMVSEIFDVFNNIGSIQINSFINMVNPNSLGYVNPRIGSTYLDITINTVNKSEFDKKEIIIDLLQSALKESSILKNAVIDSRLQTFFTENQISSIHPMIGTTKDDLIKKFDNFIESQQNFELTFAQKINKFKK